jgi:hypothetical protein
MSMNRMLISSFALTALVLGCKGPAPETATTNTSATTTTATTSSTTAPPATTTFPFIPPVQISGTIPTTVPFPSNTPPNATSEQVRPFFDWFSWESFIALNWPAGTGRGNPDQPNNPSVFTSMTNTTPVTWGTYKANWELFDQYDKRPTVWNDYNSPYAPALCPQAKPSDKQLLMVTKGDTELQDVNQAFSFPLVDQSSNYVYFEVRYNQPQYEWIRGTDNTPTTWLYLMKNLPPCTTQPCTGVALPPNPQNPADSIMLKAAWRSLGGTNNSSGMQAKLRQRYYTVNAWVYNSQTQQCTQQLMGLVGFHIAQKTKDFPEWIWSTFEQVDNVPPKVDNVPSSFNNGTDNPSTGTQGFANRPTYTAPGQLPPTPTPTQVTRLNPIPTTPPGASTVDVNNAFHAALPKNSIWQYYQLVITQWPANATQFKAPANRGVYPQDCGGAFPVNGAVNTTLETYFQNAQLATGAGGNSCMSCHFNAGTGLRDFSWGLARRPHQDAPPPSNSKMKATTQQAAK